MITARIFLNTRLAGRAELNMLVICINFIFSIQRLYNIIYQFEREEQKDSNLLASSVGMPLQVAIKAHFHATITTYPRFARISFIVSHTARSDTPSQAWICIYDS